MAETGHHFHLLTFVDSRILMIILFLFYEWSWFTMHKMSFKVNEIHDNVTVCNWPIKFSYGWHYCCNCLVYSIY